MIVTDATDALLKEFYGELPGIPVDAVVVTNDDKPLAVSGIKYEDGFYVFFADITDELREHRLFKRVVVVCYRRIMKDLPDEHVFSRADPAREGSVALLEHLGFRHIDGDTWVI